MFNALIDLLRDVWQWLDPFVVVNEYELGVLIRRGLIADRALKPGLHWRWWGIDHIECEPINERTIDLPNVYVQRGAKVRAVSANVVVQTIDPVQMWREVHDPETSIQRRAAGALATWVASVRADEKDTAELRRTIAAALRPWGVRVKRIELTTDVCIRVSGHLVEGMGVNIG